jgi:hypothetical protein
VFALEGLPAGYWCEELYQAEVCDAICMESCPVEAECGAPAVDDQNDLLVWENGVEKGREVAHVVCKAVGEVWYFIRLAHAD